MRKTWLYEEIFFHIGTLRRARLWSLIPFDVVVRGVIGMSGHLHVGMFVRKWTKWAEEHPWGLSVITWSALENAVNTAPVIRSPSQTLLTAPWLQTLIHWCLIPLKYGWLMCCRKTLTSRYSKPPILWNSHPVVCKALPMTGEEGIIWAPQERSLSVHADILPFH